MVLVEQQSILNASSSSSSSRANLKQGVMSLLSKITPALAEEDDEDEVEETDELEYDLLACQFELSSDERGGADKEGGGGGGGGVAAAAADSGGVAKAIKNAWNQQKL